MRAWLFCFNLSYYAGLSRKVAEMNNQHTIGDINSPKNGDISSPVSSKSCILQDTDCITKTIKLYEQKVADVLLRKGSNITTVQPGDSVLDALRIMADQNIGSVMVMENGRYLGIMTERDYSRKIILKGRSSTDTPVSEIMSNDFPVLPRPIPLIIACS